MQVRCLQPLVSPDRLAIVPLLPEAIVAKLFLNRPPPKPAAKPAQVATAPPKALGNSAAQSSPAHSSPAPTDVAPAQTHPVLVPPPAANGVAVAQQSADPLSRVESVAQEIPTSATPAAAVAQGSPAVAAAAPQPVRQSIQGRPRGTPPPPPPDCVSCDIRIFQD